MTALPSLLLALHALAAVVWVGGMFFAYLVLRPAAGPLEPPDRQGLWRRAFGGFFPWVWLSILVLLVSGYALIFHVHGGFGAAGLHIHLMQGTGLLMMALYLHLFFAPWRRYRSAVDRGEREVAARNLEQIRRIVGINLALGLLTVALGASGRYW